MFQKRYVALCLQLSRETHSKFITKNEIQTMMTTVDIRRALKPGGYECIEEGLVNKHQNRVKKHDEDSRATKRTKQRTQPLGWSEVEIIESSTIPSHLQMQGHSLSTMGTHFDKNLSRNISKIT
jgi:hypothetical protein